jgi:hypothetical protein
LQRVTAEVQKDRPGSLPSGELRDTRHEGTLAYKCLKGATTEMGMGSTKTGQVRKGGIIRWNGPGQLGKVLNCSLREIVNYGDLSTKREAFARNASRFCF